MGEDPCKLFVAKLAWAATEDQLYEEFERHGKVKECKIITDRDTGKSKGFAFVTFECEKDAADAVKCMDGKDICDRQIMVQVAKAREGGGGGRGGGYGGRGGGGGGRDYNSGGRSSYGGHSGGGHGHSGGGHGHSGGGSKSYGGGDHY